MPALYNSCPVPSFLYKNSPYAYSVIIQLYARSAQLDSRDTLTSHLSSKICPWCRFGCNKTETTHHLFISCPLFNSLHSHSSEVVLESMTKLIPPGIHPAMQFKILHITKSLFLDSDQWLAFLTKYYLGFILVILHLPRHTQQLILNLWHMESIKLAGRIWAMVRKKGFQDKHLSDAHESHYHVSDIVWHFFCL